MLTQPLRLPITRQSYGSVRRYCPECFVTAARERLGYVSPVVAVQKPEMNLPDRCIACEAPLAVRVSQALLQGEVIPWLEALLGHGVHLGKDWWLANALCQVKDNPYLAMLAEEAIIRHPYSFEQPRLSLWGRAFDADRFTQPAELPA